MPPAEGSTFVVTLVGLDPVAMGSCSTAHCCAPQVGDGARWQYFHLYIVPLYSNHLPTAQRDVEGVQGQCQAAAEAGTLSHAGLRQLFTQVC